VIATQEAYLDDRWADLYRESRPLIYRTVALMVGSAEAEEVVQDAFERAMRKADFFEDVQEPVGWLRKVAARQALGRLRRRRIWDRLRLRLGPTEDAEPWEKTELAIALRALEPRDRVVLVLRYYQDATYEEIAGALGVAASSVGPLLTRARAKVREALT
jgi:RNA polymerase sigma-70 factor, ECF subfamily